MSALPKPPKKSWYKRWWVWFLMITALLIGGAVTIQLMMDAAQTDSIASQQAISAAKHDLVKAVSTSGKIAPEQSEALAFNLASKVTEVSVQPGDDVEQDDLLAKTAFQQLKAPFDGRVISVNTFEGDLPIPGATVIEVGYRSNFIDVIASESEVFDIAVGQSVELSIPTYDNGATTYHGTVETVYTRKTSTSAMTGQGTSTDSGYLVRIRPTDLPAAVNNLIDLTVNVKILVDQRTDVLAIERAAIQYRDDDTAYVTVPGTVTADDSDPAPVEQTVVTGFEGDDYIEIVSGLTEGQQVLLNIPKAETATVF